MQAELEQQRQIQSEERNASQLAADNFTQQYLALETEFALFRDAAEAAKNTSSSEIEALQQQHTSAIEALQQNHTAETEALQQNLLQLQQKVQELEGAMGLLKTAAEEAEAAAAAGAQRKKAEEVYTYRLYTRISINT